MQDFALKSENIVRMTLAEGAISFILEDFVEVGLQFFYFEKFAFMPNDSLVYINSVIMVLKALEFTIRIITELKNKWNSQIFFITGMIIGESFPKESFVLRV